VLWTHLPGEFGIAPEFIGVLCLSAVLRHEGVEPRMLHVLTAGPGNL